MKSKTKSIKYLLFILLFFQMKLVVGQWGWEWGSQTRGGSSWDSMIDVLSTDFFNNIYCAVRYQDSIFFPDTSFSHQTSPATWDYVIAKYSPRGSFLGAINIHSKPYEYIQKPYVTIDDSLNLYIATSFVYQLFLQDSIFYPHPTSHPWNSDNILIKMNPDHEILWSGLIYNYLGDRFFGLEISGNNMIYVGCEHESSGMVYYLDQDSAYFNYKSGLSLVKSDSDGNLVWHRQIHSTNVGTSGFKMRVSDNGLIHIFGRAMGDLVVDGDTLFLPPLGSLLYARFIISFDQDGNMVKGQFLSTDFWNYDFVMDDLNEIYILGQYSDTLLLGSDTLIAPDGANWKLLIKYDSLLNPIWYKNIPVGNNLPVNWMRIELDGKNLIFTGTCFNNFQIGDTILNLGSKKQVVVGELDSNGELVNIQSTASTNDIKSFSLILDNCKNPVLGGNFLGQTIFGQDTLNSANGHGYITKLTRNIPGLLNLVTDTIACKEYLFSAPEGYLYYSWNGIITDQNLFMVYETGTYFFACSDQNGCWLYDTINIEILPGFEISIGNDTSIRLYDTISFSLPEQYESYLWFDGSTSHKITLIGSQFGLGTFPVWVEVTDGPCIESDTIILTVKSAFGIDETENAVINIYPNPFNSSFTIDIEPGFESLEIYDLRGIVKLSKQINKLNNQSYRIETENLEKGIYILKIKTSNKNLVKKIIKI